MQCLLRAHGDELGLEEYRSIVHAIHELQREERDRLAVAPMEIVSPEKNETSASAAQNTTIAQNIPHYVVKPPLHQLRSVLSNFILLRSLRVSIYT